MAKSERAELEEALAMWEPTLNTTADGPRILHAARKYRDTLPPDPVKAKELFCVIDTEGNWYAAHHDRDGSEYGLKCANTTGKLGPYRIVRYVPQEE